MLNIAGSIGPAQIRTKDPDLSTYAADWREDQDVYVARKACSRVVTQSIDASFPIFDRETMMAQRAELIGNEGVAARAKSVIDRTHFRVKGWGFEDHIGEFTASQSMSTGLNPEDHSVEVCTEALNRRQEQEYKNEALDDSVWDGVAVGRTAATDIALNPFDSANRGIQQVLQDDAEPIRDFQLMRTGFLKQTGYAPNVCILGGDLAPVLFNHDNVIDRVNRGQTNGVAEITEMQWSAAIRVANTYVMESVDVRGTFFFEKGFWLGYVNPNPGSDGVTAISCFSYDALTNGA